MSIQRTIHFIAMVAAITLVSSVNADDVTTCKKGGKERRIQIVYPNGGDSKLPCEVRDFKDGDSEGKMLYNATNDATYCATKAQEFVSAKLTPAGWECGGTSEAAPAEDASKK